MADREDWPRGAFGGGTTAPTSINREKAEHHPRPDITNDVISGWAADRADDAGALARRVISLTNELATMKADRPYIIGCLHGWDAAVEGGQAHPSAALTALVAELDAAKAENRVLAQAARMAIDLLAERKHGSPARSSAHNARLVLESVLTSCEAAAPAQHDACARSDCPTGDGLICPDCAQREGGA